MIDINNYIVEKLKINKDSKTNNFDEINNKFISDIKKYIIEKYPMIKFNSYNEYINVGKSKKYIFLNLQKQHKWIYKSIAKWIEGNLNVLQPCKSNNILYLFSLVLVIIYLIPCIIAFNIGLKHYTSTGA